MTGNRTAHRRRRGAVLTCVAGVASLVAVVGCTQSPAPPTTSVDARFPPAIAASREDPEAPPTLREFDPLVRCEDVILDQGEQIPEASRTCLAAAAGSAELAVAAPTTEGDPIVTFLVIESPGAQVQLFTDSSHDRFGSSGWSTSTCPDVASVNGFGGCG